MSPRKKDIAEDFDFRRLHSSFGSIPPCRASRWALWSAMARAVRIVEQARRLVAQPMKELRA